MAIQEILQAGLTAAAAANGNPSAIKGIAEKLVSDLVIRVVNEDTRPDSEIPVATIIEGQSFRKLLRDKSLLERFAEKRGDGSIVEVERKTSPAGVVTQAEKILVAAVKLQAAAEELEALTGGTVTTVTESGDMTENDTAEGGAAVPNTGA